MRIAWFTPLSARTGVARYSQSAVKALSGKAHVDVWTSDMPDNLPVQCASVHEAAPGYESFNKLETYDAVVYNMGNNIDFHFEIYEFYRRRKGMVILHDKVMHHFNAGYFLERLKRPEGYIALMHYYHGASGKKAAESSLVNPPPVWETEDVVDYPLFQNFLWNASAIVVHSKESRRLIAKASPLVPTECIHHPFYLHGGEEASAAPLRTELALPDDKTILLSFGHLNKPKRIDKVLEAIGSNRAIRESVYYVVAGDCPAGYLEQLRSLASSYGLENAVRFTGYVEDDMLTRYIRAADICVNLRYPSTESSSGALIEQLYHGKPVVVTKIGFYDELPDGAVVKIDLKNETDNLARELGRLVNDKRLRDSVGESGHRFARETFSPEVYAAKFLDFAERVPALGLSLDLIDRVSDEMLNIATPRCIEVFSARVAKELSAL